jgi:two-component system sensor histidine kinase RegB
MTGPISREAIHFGWLLKLRWLATVAQLVLLAAAALLLDVTVQWAGVAAVLLLELMSNGVGEALRRAQATRPVALRALMAADVVLFTALLYFTGGPANPFSFLYLVYIALGAVVLDVRWSWALAALALALLGVIYLVVPADAEHHHHALHLKGMWVALAVASVFIVYFVSRVSSALVERERQLEQARRLASLATLATGAAHELSTPLSTIAVVAKELERRLDSEAERQDASLVRAEVERCRTILSRLAVDVGVTQGEPLVELDAKGWAAQAVDELDAAQAVRIEGEDGLKLFGPRRALVQALKSVVDNGLKASPKDKPLTLAVARRGAAVELKVSDAGAGIRDELLPHVGEPFFTTRAPGTGMGLGVFLARAVVEQAGGSMHIASRPSAGTTVTLRLPGAQA